MGFWRSFCSRSAGSRGLSRPLLSASGLSRPARTAGSSESRVYQSRRVAAASTASGATHSRAGPAAPLRRAGGGIARFAASTTSWQRTVWHAWIVFSQADFMRSQPSGGRGMAATHQVVRWSRRRRARAAIHCFDIQGWESASTASTAKIFAPDAAYGPARRKPPPNPATTRGRPSF